MLAVFNSCLHCFIFLLQFLTACMLQITCGCSTDGPDCESSREYEGQDAEVGQAAHSHRLGSGHLLGGKRPRQSGESHTIPLTDGFGCWSGRLKNIGSATLLSRLIQLPAVEQVYYRKVKKY
jgi:hypothetical protein